MRRPVSWEWMYKTLGGRGGGGGMATVSFCDDHNASSHAMIHDVSLHVKPGGRGIQGKRTWSILYLNEE